MQQVRRALIENCSVYNAGTTGLVIGVDSEYNVVRNVSIESGACVRGGEIDILADVKILLIIIFK